MRLTLLACVFLIGFAFLVLAICVGYFTNAISVEGAVERFKDIAQTENVEVVRHSNNGTLTGDPHDVIFELKVNGKPVSGRCTSGTFSQMVCRFYSDG